MAQRLHGNRLGKHRIGHDDFLHRRQLRRFQLPTLHVGCKQLLSAGTIDHYAVHIGLFQKIQNPGIACTLRAAVNGLNKNTAVAGLDSDGHGRTVSVVAVFDADKQLAGKFRKSFALQFLPFPFADGGFLIISEPKPQTLNVEINLIRADFILNGTFC